MDLPDNLYESGGYYTWRHPVTKRKFGLGRDRADAIDQAREANEALERPARLIERAVTPPARILRDFLPTYRAQLEARTMAPRTRFQRKRQVAAIEKSLGDVVIRAGQEDAAEITRRSAVFLKTYSDQGKRRMAKVLRGALVDLYAAMASEGWLSVNPATVIKLEPSPVRRSRLTLETFQRIYEAAGELEPWVQKSMALALVTVQRREDVASMTFRNVEDGRLRVQQHKTGARIRIPLELRLQAVGWSVGDVIARCRDDVVSPHLLHHTRHQGNAKPGKAVFAPTLSAAFLEARKRAGIVAEEGKTLPSFHELRSLGMRLYLAQGYDPQALAGHKDPSTTAIYLDDRGAEWIDVAA